MCFHCISKAIFGSEAFRAFLDFVWLVGYLTSSSASRVSRGRVPRLAFDNFTCCHTETEMTTTQPILKEGGERTRDLLRRNRALYRLRYSAPGFSTEGKRTILQAQERVIQCIPFPAHSTLNNPMYPHPRPFYPEQSNVSPSPPILP